MSKADPKHIWGQDVERLVHWIPGSNKRRIYQAETLLPGKSVVYVEQENSSYTGIVHTIKISERDEYETVGHIILETPEGKMITIPCHLESIPYGFDVPDRYELVIDRDITAIEILEKLA